MLAAAGAAEAGPWAQKRGEGQVIVKAERMRATDGFDPAGALAPLPAERVDEAVSVFAEYGLTDRFTLQLKGEHQAGRDFFVDYEGRGPIELGVTWQAWRDERTAVSLYAGYAWAGEGRNAGYASPGVGEHDLEVRVSAGRSFAVRKRAGRLTFLQPDSGFVEGQAARRVRDGLPDETRIDLTAGGRYGRRWMLLNQVYAGESDGGARWASIETSVVRDLGRWSLQAGWRHTAAGRETPAASGPLIALWRRF